MPRERAERYSIAATPQRASVKVPLNDDKREKANRLHQRQAAQGAHLHSVRASATPNRNRLSLAAGANSPHTPLNDQDGIPTVAGTAITPMKYTVPLQANFEEWMKLATDNKINANNSWNFALIDYFHDMSLLKEGDGVDFQKASCTLDGCVKIYTSRVDSVADDTGKLLNGLAESGNKKRRGDAEGDGEGDDEEGEEGEDGQKKRKRRAQRSAEATLATSFEQLQNKKVDSELAVDPLFKKASADFDEGGAKGLLLNHLAIDSKGRIVFDSSDDAQDASAGTRASTAPAPGETEEQDKEDAEEDANEDIQIDLSGLAAKYFPDLAQLDDQWVCPSLKTFDLFDASGSLDLPFLNAPEDWKDDEEQANDEEEGDRSGMVIDDDNAMGFDDDDGGMAGFDLPPETGFGEGGEAWAREAHIEPQMRVHNMGEGADDDDARDGTEGTEDGIAGAGNYQYGVPQGRTGEQENILNYFDNALKKNWAGPEHWRIKRIKEIGKAPPVTKRKEKEPFEIDFAAPMSQALADALYTPAASNAAISLPKAQWKSKSRNLLPDDKHFNSKNLLRLFLKPRCQVGGARRRAFQGPTRGPKPGSNEDVQVDAAYWANQENRANANAEAAPQGNYDADFFQDDGLGQMGDPFDDDDDNFADARDHFSPPAEEIPGQTQALDGVLAGAPEGAFGSQLVAQNRRFRPEYVQYARKAKRVDVHRLKEKMWHEIGFEEKQAPLPSEPADQATPRAADATLNFKEVMTSLKTVYPKQQMDDISTSYCFICVLHLANEKGLVIENVDNFEDLTIRKDFTADLSVGE